MSLPAEWTQIPVSWTLLSQNDGTPCVGRVRFTAENSVLTDGKTFVPDPIFANVVNGVMESINLPSTDDPQISPQQWVWKVEAQTIPTGPAPFYIDVPYDTVGTLNIATAVPLRTPSRLPTVPGPGGSDAGVAGYVADDDSATRTALNAAIAGAVGDPGTEIGATLSATYAPHEEVGAPRPKAGRQWLFLGDSHCAGVGASDVRYAWPRQAIHLAGTFYAERDSLVSGHPGEPSASLLARIPDILDTYGDALDGVVIEWGANDANGFVLPADLIANTYEAVRLCQARGLAVVVCGVPPKETSASNDQRRTYTDAYNVALSIHVPRMGAVFADTYPAVADPVTPFDLLASLSNVGLQHMNDAGHLAFARPVAEAMRACFPGDPIPPSRIQRKLNILPNGFMTGAGSGGGDSGIPATGGWSHNETGTAPTFSLVDDASGELPGGRWEQIEVNAAADSIVNLVAGVGSVNSARVLSCTGYIQIEVVAGDWEAACLAHGAGYVTAAIQTSGGAATLSQSFDFTTGRKIGAGLYQVGPFRIDGLTTGTGTHRIQLTAAFPTGLHAKVRFGAIEVLNETGYSLDGVTT